MTGTPVQERFRRTFGGLPHRVVRSPGRVNLIGEHTDYHDGFVLPAAIDLGTDVAVRRRDDGRLRVVAARLEAVDEVALHDLRFDDGPEWTQYVRGCAALLLSAGHDLSGADLLIDGDLPIGGGLSSSASLEVGVTLALTTLSERSLDRVALAELCRRVENEIVGVRSGVMDQLAVACGVAGHAILIDCRTASTTAVPFPASTRVLILDSAVPRTLAGSAYNRRRDESAAALHAIQQVAPNVATLRDVTPQLLSAVDERLDDVQRRRARHVVTENERVLECAAALRRVDVETVGRLMTQSHASLRDDYEVSGPELDALVASALDTPGVFGARLTGAGFGGCVVALLAADRADEAAPAILRRYGDATGRDGTAYLCQASDGAHVAWEDHTAR